MRPRSNLLPLLALLALLACGDGRGATATVVKIERTCTQASALSSGGYKGTSLAAKQLALTFDDGPGTRTSELSAWLAARGISATFFVNGANLAGYPGLLAKLVADGHAVANHTQDHRDLTSRMAFPLGASGDAAIVAELADTDALIAPFVTADRFMFRAPYGAYDARAHAVLHASSMDKYTGTIGWDIGGQRTATSGADWSCWENAPKLTSKDCADLYAMEIASVGRGIVLLHDADKGDSANVSLTTGVGNTVDMTKYLVPVLVAQGFSFVRTEDVPDIAAALPALPALDAGLDASDASDAVTNDAGGDSSAAELGLALAPVDPCADPRARRRVP